MASNRVAYHPSTTYSQRLSSRKTKEAEITAMHMMKPKKYESSIRGSRGRGMYDLFEVNITAADIDLV